MNTQREYQMNFECIHDQWKPFLLKHESRLNLIRNRIDSERDAGFRIFPQRDILRVFQQDPQRVKVLILGQDPYPTPGHANGLAFSVSSEVSPLPKTLNNIFREYVSDLNLPFPKNGDLTPWMNRGVFLLNIFLTFNSNEPISHRNIGWEEITRSACEYLIHLGNPLVIIAWGNFAQSAIPKELPKNVRLIESAHPSPLSAYRGFMNSKPFSRSNRYLVEMNADPIDWNLNV